MASKKKVLKKPAAAGKLSFSEAMVYLFSVVRGNVSLVSLRLTKDGDVMLATYGKPVDDFRAMTVTASAEQLSGEGFDENPAVVSFPLLLAACGIGSKAAKKAAPEVKVMLDREERTLYVHRSRSITKLPLYPHQADDDQFGAVHDASAASKKTWTALPVSRLLAAGEVMQANRLKMVDDLANSKSRASLVLQTTGDGVTTAAISNNFSCFIRVLDRDGLGVPPVTVSVFAADMLRSMMRSPEDVTGLRMYADASSNLLILNTKAHSALLLRMPLPAAGAPSPADIAVLFANIMRSQKAMAKSRFAGCKAGELKTVLTEAALFAEADEGDDPVVDLALAKDLSLSVEARRDARTSAARTVEHSSVAKPPLAAWKAYPSIRLGVHGLRTLLAAVPDEDTVLVYPSTAGNAVLIAHRSGKVLKSVAALTARAKPATKKDADQ